MNQFEKIKAMSGDSLFTFADVLTAYSDYLGMHAFASSLEGKKLLKQIKNELKELGRVSELLSETAPAPAPPQVQEVPLEKPVALCLEHDEVAKGGGCVICRFESKRVKSMRFCKRHERLPEVFAHCVECELLKVKYELEKARKAIREREEKEAKWRDSEDNLMKILEDL